MWRLWTLWYRTRRAAMPDEELTAFIKGIKSQYAVQAKQKKSDDIIQFIEANWKMFVPIRRMMTDTIMRLGRDVSYSVDSLCDLLGIPNNVYFKRTPVADIGGAILDFETSKLLELFNECRKHHDEVCLVVVAGKKSICITNMQTAFDLCKYDIKYKAEDVEIHIFKAKDMPIRLPKLFNLSERY